MLKTLSMDPRIREDDDDLAATSLHSRLREDDVDLA